MAILEDSADGDPLGALIAKLDQVLAELAKTADEARGEEAARVGERWPNWVAAQLADIAVPVREARARAQQLGVARPSQNTGERARAQPPPPPPPTPVPVAAALAAAAKQAAHKPRILIIDDELTFARAVHRFLSRTNEVTIASTGKEALGMIGGGGRFEVILCDLMMPLMTGMELHAELLRVHPDLARRIVFMSGGAYTPHAREFLDRVPNRRLEKPIDVHALRTLVEEVLGELPGRSV